MGKYENILCHYKRVVQIGLDSVWFKTMNELIIWGDAPADTNDTWLHDDCNCK